MSVLLVVALTIGARASQPAIDAFYLELERALARNDRRAVASLMVYPLNVTAAGVRLPISDEASLLKHYDAIFTPAFTAAVANPTLRDRVVTVMAVQGATKVIEIRVPVVPLSDDSSQPQASARGASRGGAPRAAARQPERIVFRTGGGTGQFAGMLRPAATDSYVFGAVKGQFLEVRVERVRARDIVARVLDAKSVALDPRAAEGARVWTGRVPADGDYRIDIVRLLKEGTQPLAYTLVVTLR
jgi:hypothetical protein